MLNDTLDNIFAGEIITLQSFVVLHSASEIVKLFNFNGSWIATPKICSHGCNLSGTAQQVFTASLLPYSLSKS